MSQELLYTSAPRGLKPGSRGFCTVLCTQGMPAPLASAVEALSGYRPIYSASDERAAHNPVVYSHLKMQATGRSWHVLSRISDYGLDYSQRANKLAHHVILDNQTEQLPGGPANLLSMPGFMRDEWEGEPKLVALKPVTREPRAHSGICQRWQEQTGDAGWAGVVAESFLRDPDRLVILLFAPGQDILSLFSEVLSLLPPEKRWDATFSTYFTGLATGTTCLWRAVVHDSKEARESLRFVNALRLDLTADSLGPAAGGDLVEAARSEQCGTALPRRAPPPMTSAQQADAGSETPDEEFVAAENEQDEIRFAGIPQNPPQLSTGRATLPIASVPPKQRRGRRLADVIEAESRRPTSRRWLWLSLSAFLLMLVTSLSIGIVTGQIKLTQTDSRLAARALDGHKDQTTTANEAKSEVLLLGQNGLLEGESQHRRTPPVAANLSHALPNTASPATATSHEVVPAILGPPAPTDTAAAPSSKVQVQPQVNTNRTTLTLPTEINEKTILHSFDAVDASKWPKIVLLKPSWLPYFDMEPGKRIDTTIYHMVVEQTGSEVDELAHFTVNTDSKRITHYKLKKLKPKASALGWYGLQLRSPDSPNDVIKSIFFSSFPISVSPAECKLMPGGKTVHWVLPKTAQINEPHKMPLFAFDKFTISIGEHAASVLPESSASGSEWTILCKPITDTCFSSLMLDKNKSRQIKIRIRLRRAEVSSLELDLVGWKEFVDEARDNSKEKLLALAITIDENEKKRIKTAIEGALGAGASQAKIDDARKECEIIQKSIGINAENETNTDQKNKCKTQVMEVGKIISDLDMIDRFHVLVKAASCLTVVSARIYYELVDPHRKYPPIQVDVVKIGDMKANESKQSKESNP